jgi:hypothetical protein
MTAGSDRRRRSKDAVDGPSFVVEHFGWGAPDRLELAGTFSGLATEPPAGAVLTVFGEDGPHRLPAIDADGEWKVDGERMTAAFAWLEAPVAFDRARLELGGSIAVELRAPGAENDGEPVPVEVIDAGDEQAPPVPEPPRQTPDLEGAADRLRLETQLLEEAEELEEARAKAREAEAALHRAQEDLAAERERRAADAERFRDGLAMVRRSAEEAVAAATEARAEAEEQASNEIAVLRERIAALEPASAERDAARAELARAHEELDTARAALTAARAGAQELLDQLSEIASGRR